MMLPVTPQVFHRIQLRRIAGQKLQAQATALSSHPVAHDPAAVRGGLVPNHQEVTWNMPPQVAQELDDLRTADCSRKEPEIKIPPSHPRQGRQQAPVEVVLQNGSLPLGRPSSATMGPLAQSAFVDEDDGLALPSGVFF